MFTALPDTDLFMPGCFSDPRYSPAEGWKTKENLVETCQPVLPSCTPCPHRAQCIRQVRPHPTKFDGVCGGRLWLDGEVIATADGVHDEDLPLPGKPRPKCGTADGLDLHHTAGEQPCEACRDAADFAAAVEQLAAVDAEAEQIVQLANAVPAVSNACTGQHLLAVP
ncbi:hypothetical protein ACIQ9P_03705 [Kitasatospora sp. NPDC094019]|uniref:hypothetical protein n=1 Tax=Kitasatospora sp. NPDC094019 TaxID=3364091 RepID=UPI003819A927